MKKAVTLILLATICLGSAFLYLKYDNKSTSYGLKCTFCDQQLPYGLTPQYNTDYPQNFVLLDDDGYTLVGQGFRYETTDFTVKHFLCYGYNDTSVIAACTDSLGNYRYLSSYKTGYKSNKGKPDISFEEIDSTTLHRIQNNYQWVEVSETAMGNIRFLKFIFLMGILLSGGLIIRQLFKLSKRRKKDNVVSY